MSSFSLPISTLEELPDELLLLICRYLSSTDILFSFYGLNSRLSQTISGFCQYVVLGQVPFQRFSYICKSILPSIGTNICSLILNNEWKGTLPKTFLSYFGGNMSLIFPHLKRLTLIVLYTKSLALLLDCLQNLTELCEITIHQLSNDFKNSNELETLLHQVLLANNSRLKSITFGSYSDPFSFGIQTNDLSFSNIEKLHINLKTINDLHRLLTVLPRLCCLYTWIYEEPFGFDKQSHYTTLFNLKYFHLRSIRHSWTLDKLMSIIKRIPNVEELSIAINTNNDDRLTDGEQFVSLSSAVSLRNFNYFLQFNYLLSSIDHTKILSTWKQFKQEFVCIKSDDNKILALYTLPFVFSYLILPSPLGKNEVFIENYASQVKDLVLYDVSTHIIDIFPVIKKCHKIAVLELRISKNLVSQVSKQIQLSKLPHLVKITTLDKLSIDTEDFRRILEVSPNLHHLAINYEVLRSLLDNECVCLLLKQRITQIYIYVSSSPNLEPVISSISQLPSILPSLKHLYFRLEKGYQSAESLILAVLNCLSKWNSLVSFGAVDVVITEETLSKGLQQWVMENSTLDEHSLFVIDYTDETFRLWI